MKGAKRYEAEAAELVFIEAGMMRLSAPMVRRYGRAFARRLMKRTRLRWRRRSDYILDPLR